MSDNINVKVGATTAGLESGMERAAAKVESSTLRMNASLGGLGNAIERVKVPLFALVGIGAGAELFKHVISTTAEFGVQLDILSQKTGIAVASLTALQYAAEITHVGTASLDTGLKLLSRSMEEALILPSSNAARAFDAMGVSIKDANGHTRSLNDLLFEIADKFHGYADGAQKTALALEIFGRSGADMVPLLNQGSAAIHQMMGDAQQLGVVMTDQQAHAATEYEDAMDRMKAAVEGLSHTLATALMPAITSAVNMFTAHVGDITAFGDALKALAFAAGAAGAAKALELLAGVIGGQLFTTIAALIPEITSLRDAVVLLQLAGAPLLLTFAAIPALVAAAGLAIYDLTQHFKDNAAAADEAAKNTKSYVDYLKALGKAEAHDPRKKHGAGLPAAPDLATGPGREHHGKTPNPLALFNAAMLRIDRAAATLGEQYDRIFGRLEANVRKAEGAATKAMAKGQTTSRTAGVDAAVESIRQLTEGLGRANAKAAADAKARAQEIKQEWIGAFDAIHRAVATTFDAVIRGTLTMHAAMHNMIRSIELEFIQSEEKKLEVKIASALASKGISAQSALEEIAVHAATAAAGAWSAMASIPYVGPEIAVGVAAATLAGVLALGARIASAAGGYDIPAGVNPVTQLHAQEMVLPARYANVIRNMAATDTRPGASGDVHHWHVSTMDAKSFKETMMTHRDTLAGVVKSLAREGKF